MNDQAAEEVREQVRSRYAAAARAVLDQADRHGGCCGSSSCCGTAAAAIAEQENGFGGPLYREGETDGLPTEAISNCVINLSADKPAVLAEMHRVLVPGGRIGISDMVAGDHLSAADRAAPGLHAAIIRAVKPGR